MKKKFLVLGLSLFLVGCSNNKKEVSNTETEKSSSVQKENDLKTTKDIQQVFNELVDENIKFLEIVKDEEKAKDTNLVVNEIKKNIDVTDKFINKLELVDNSKIEASTKEVLALARSFRTYYGLLSEGESEKAQTELLIAYGSITEISKKCFNGELPPYMSSFEKEK